MFFKLRKHRTYQYTPRFYKPEKEPRERRPIRFRRRRQKTSTRSLIFGFVAIALVIYILHILTQIAK